MKTAICIAYLNEPDLCNTVASVHESMPDAFIVAIEDNHQEGPGAIRHRCIEYARRADCDVAIIIDAHMRFKPDTLPEMAAYVRNRPTHLATCECWHNERCEMAGGKAPYKGAVFQLKEAYADQCHAIVPKWRAEAEPITCVMGACYAFTLDWYYHIGAPLRLLQAWGCDEELLSGCTWFHGGEVVCLPFECAHLYRTGSTANFDTRYLAGVWANEMAKVNLFPMPHGLRSELLDHVRGSGFVQCFGGHVLSRFYNVEADVTNERDRMTKAAHECGRTWAEWEGLMRKA